MNTPVRLALLLILAAPLTGCAAQSQTVQVPLAGAAGILRTAQQAAASSADPVAAKLVVWLAAQIPGPRESIQPTPAPVPVPAGQIDSFLRANPDWPGRAVLNQRLQQALAVEPDDAVARTLCMAHRPDTTPSLLRCATALIDLQPGPPSAGVLLPLGKMEPGMPTAPLLPLSPAALPSAIVDAARAAWVAGIDDASDEAEFLRLFGSLPTPADQWQRFDRLEWKSAGTASRRQIARLSPADRPLATARLALHHDDAGADGLAAALSGIAARDPAMLLDLARWLRRHDRDDAAMALWHGRALDAERMASPARQPAYWTEREALAREMLSRPRDSDALFLADDTVQANAAARLDIDFLTGWIGLRRLHDAPGAALRFGELARSSRSVITSSRGFYWLGRALEAQGHVAEARDAYGRAAARPTSFYGQAAIHQLSPDDAGTLAEAISRLHDPVWTSEQAIGFAGLELARAATLLVAWNDPHHARAFLLRLDELAGDDRGHALAAGFAVRLGLPDVAVAIARNAGRHDLVLAGSGWPAPYAPPAEPVLPAGLALGIMRQESSFDATIVSPAGAHGLMQLMPSTARAVAARRASGPGANIETGALFDPDTNMALGTSYLAGLLERFGGIVPYAVAAYNAGPRRVDQWLQQNGNPSNGNTALSFPMIDWIELIPFSETRNYVQRVMENQAVYRARAATGGLPGGSSRVAWSGAAP